MVERIQNIIKEVKAERGDLTLFLLWKDSAQINKWSVVISAAWVDQMGEAAAFNYWIDKLQKGLTKNDLEMISRLNFLRVDDRLTNLFTRAFRMSGGSMRLTKSKIGDYYIEDVIVFECSNYKRDEHKLSSYQRNPVFNSQLNPNLNSAINPNLNSALNPNLNSAINPNLNQNFEGFFLYDTSLNKMAYLVDNKRSGFLMFDFNNQTQGFCIKAREGFFNVFSWPSIEWKSYLVSNRHGGFNLFNTNGHWIGFLA